MANGFDSDPDSSDAPAGARVSWGASAEGTSAEALKDKLALLEEALEAISEGFVLYDRDDRVLAFNGKHRDLFPSIRELIRPGVSYRTLLEAQLKHGFFESVRGREEEWLNNRLAERRRPSASVEQDFEDGRTVRLSEHNTPSGGLVSIRTDITDLRRAERELRKQHNLLLESLAEGVYGLDTDGRCTFANRSCVEMLGFDSELQLRGLPMFERVHVDTAPPDGSASRLDDLKAGRAMHQEETFMMRRDGSIFPASYRAHPVRQDERIVGFVVTFLDTTERRHATQEKEALEARLRQAHKMEAIGQLAGGIAHDFNNILAIVLGFADLALLEMGSADDVTEHLQEIRRAGLRARDLVAQLLTFSRENPDPEVSHAGAAAIEEVVSLLQPILSAGMNIEFHAEDPDLAMALSPAELHQLLLNLCINARDAMDSTGEIRIGLKRVDNQRSVCSSCGAAVVGAFASVEVSDTGTGMQSNVAARMFDPFYTTKPMSEGTGMGLSVVHGIVHERGGHVQVETSAERGTRVGLLLPIAASIPAAASGTEIFRQAHFRSDALGRRIWIVDDEMQICRFLATLFRAEGYVVRTFMDPREALAVFEQSPDEPDLLLTDQTMPGLSGLELAGTVRARRPDLPIVLCTGYHDQLDALGPERTANDRAVRKPLDSTELSRAVLDLLVAVPGAAGADDGGELQ
ncbi:MAG: PAS-domain containing protein [Pseudomonadota bacterium]